MLTKLLIILFLYLPFQIALNPVEGFDVASIRIIIPLLFLLWLLQGLKDKKILVPFNLTTILLLSFLFFNIFSLFFAENIQWGLRKLLFLLSIFPLYFIIANLTNFNKSRLLQFTVIGAGTSALIGIAQFLAQFIFSVASVYSFWAKISTFFLGNSFADAVLKNPSWLVNINGTTVLRATAFFPDPHMFSFYLSIATLLALGILVFQTKIKNKISKFYLILFLIILVGDILTFSRGGYLGLLAGFSFFGGLFLISIKSKQTSDATISSSQSFSTDTLQNKFKKITVPILFALLIFFFIVIPNPATQRLASSFNLNEGSNASRLEIWQQSLLIISSNLFNGVGLGNYASTVEPSADYRKPIYSHNLYLDIAAETGVLNALIWLLILIISIFKAAYLFRRHNNFIYLGIASGLVAFSVHSFFETALFSVHVLPLIILLLGVSTHSRSNRGKIKNI